MKLEVRRLVRVTLGNTSTAPIHAENFNFLHNSGHASLNESMSCKSMMSRWVLPVKVQGRYENKMVFIQYNYSN